MQKADGISSAAVKKATGHTWDEWLVILDQAGAETWTHKQIVAYLHEHYELSAWWEQGLTVGYEKAKGRRVVGQTADAGFQVGVQRTLPVCRETAWKLLSSRAGIACWLGEISRLSLVEGRSYATREGTHGELRVIKPEQRIRMTWQTSSMPQPATLQITLIERGSDRVSLQIHLERLPSEESRAEMKEHWQGVLDRLAALATPGAPPAQPTSGARAGSPARRRKKP